MTEQFDASQIPTIILLFAPVSFVTICEHIGDHKNLGNIVGRDLLKEPGLTRTLIGDGVATSISGILCGAANTTYGENTAVVGVTKIASTAVIGAAAILSIFVGFFTPFTAFVETIPGSIMGGVSLLLYGFIAASGMKMLINERIDLGVNRNIFVVAVILVAGIGGLVLKIGVVEITSTAVAMILGIILNLILNPEKEAKMEKYDV
jgi:uracil permease